MPLGKATPKTVPVDYFSLVTAKDMSDCLDAVSLIGYLGMQRTYRDAQGALKKQLELDSETQKGVIAVLGQVIVWDGIKLSVFSAADFTARYSVTS